MKSIKLVVAAILIGCFSVSFAGNSDNELVKKLTKEEFYTRVMNLEKNADSWKYAGNLPCVVDFYADWCGPCRKASPILEELAEKYKGKIVVYKVNTDQEKELARAFNIRGIPAFLWVPKEGKPNMTSGIAQSDEETKAMFEKKILEILGK